MSLKTKNTAPAAPALADTRVDPRSRRAGVLRALLQYQAMPTGRLITMSGQVHTAARSSFRREVLEPMREDGLLTSRKVTSGDVWELTGLGAIHAARLALPGAQEADPATIAQPRCVGYGSEPPAPDTYRCLRPGAYDYARCPSRMGNVLTYRDGRQERAT